jgi:hypothetical protein
VKKNPRIVIKLRAGDEDTTKIDAKEALKEKKPAKRKRNDAIPKDNELSDEEVDTEPISKKRKKETVQGAKKKVGRKSDVPIDEPVQASSNRSDDDPPVFLNLKFWKQCRDSLNGTFKAARKNLTQFDWELPPGIPADKFADVANYALDKMDK